VASGKQIEDRARKRLIVRAIQCRDPEGHNLSFRASPFGVWNAGQQAKQLGLTQ
jgi:hypothetical protein